jgi:hypothetical protein
VDPDLAYPTIEDQMQLARALPGELPRGSGEPFGAVIFDRETKKLLAPV